MTPSWAQPDLPGDLTGRTYRAGCGPFGDQILTVGLIDVFGSHLTGVRTYWILPERGKRFSCSEAALAQVLS